MGEAVLSVAGLEPSGEAGLLVDLWVFREHGLRGFGVASALTAQRGEAQVLGVPPPLFEAQLRSLPRPAAVKTGMLWGAELAEILAEFVKKWRAPLVVDPVLVSSEGLKLHKDGLAEAIKVHLLPLTWVFTPNAPEAEKFLGRPVRDTFQARAAAEELLQLGPKVVLLKGGHLPEPVDVIAHRGGVLLLRHPRGPERRGTGCALASAVAARLAMGREAAEAALEGALWTLRHYIGLGSP